MSTSLPEGKIENESPCDCCAHRIIGGARVCCGRPSKAEQYRFEEQKKKESEEIDKAYKDTLKRMDRDQPAKKTDKWDPWGKMR
jgi:hypothetical protein